MIRVGTGGVLFLGGAKAPSDLRQQLMSAVGSGGSSASPLVMADVEGGGVQRLSGVVEAFPWARQLAATESVAQVEQLATAVGRQMLSAGVTVDLAPVVDLDDRSGPSSTNPDGLRSFSINPATASAYGVAFMQGLRNVGVIPVVKHFPGIGHSTQNTDYGTAATRPLSELRTAGLKPFIAAIAARAPAVMISNAYVPGLTTKPASVSRAIIHDLLRAQLGFNGLVLTDSLSAGAITAAGYTVPQAAVAAIEAGADLVLFGSTLTTADTALLSPSNVAATQHAIINALAAAFNAGDLTSTRLNEALTHVLIAKGLTICRKSGT
jgi:beta-N-acetylhexosaminidase